MQLNHPMYRVTRTRKRSHPLCRKRSTTCNHAKTLIQMCTENCTNGGIEEEQSEPTNQRLQSIRREPTMGARAAIFDEIFLSCSWQWTTDADLEAAATPYGKVCLVHVACVRFTCQSILHISYFTWLPTLQVKSVYIFLDDANGKSKGCHNLIVPHGSPQLWPLCDQLA